MNQERMAQHESIDCNERRRHSLEKAGRKDFAKNYKL